MKRGQLGWKDIKKRITKDDVRDLSWIVIVLAVAALTYAIGYGKGFAHVECREMANNVNAIEYTSRLGSCTIVTEDLKMRVDSITGEIDFK